MALATTSIHEVESGGSDTLNGGIFDPGQTAGMFTDGAATSATGNSPVFTSASYNFVAGDVGAWIFIAAGTNWTRGWYNITSVGSNAATLVGNIGSAVVLLNGTGISTTSVQLGPSTVIGCATTASPTGATWSIDYSQQLTAEIAYTDLASAGTGLTVSSVLNPFGKQQVGNSIVITGGTNFNVGRYVIASVSAGLVATVVGPTNITTGAGVTGTGGLGGCYATPGAAGAVMVASNQCFVLTATYTIASATINIATGCFAPTVATINIEGYATVRGDLNSTTASGTRPTLIASGISTFTLIAPSGGSGTTVRNFILDGATLTSSRGVNGNGITCYNVKGQNMTNGVFGNTSVVCVRCYATGCSTVTPYNNNGANHFCVADANTITGFGGNGNCLFCISSNNTGSTSDGISNSGSGAFIINCTLYGNGRHGLALSGSQTQFAVNIVAEGNGVTTGSGVGIAPSSNGQVVINYATFNNAGGATSVTGIHPLLLNPIVCSVSPFTNAAAGDFSLNNTAGGGASVRAAGYPGILPGGLTTGYIDIGAAQHADPVASGIGAQIFGS